MADKITVSVDLHGLEEDLNRLAPRIAKRLFRRALTLVGKLWVDQIKEHVPVDTGALRDSIDFVVKTSPKDDWGSVTVGPTYNSKNMRKRDSTSTSPGVYGMWVEFGLRVKKYTKHPFMRPTFDGTAEGMIQVFADKLREDLEEAVKD